MSAVLTKAKDAYVSIRGYHTDRKLIVIESDDWGSIRMPSKQTLERLVSFGDNPQDDAFLSNDCLESPEDLSMLFDALCSVRDYKGKPAVITANFAMANPRFEEIEISSGIYKFEPFYETYYRYYGENAIFEQIKAHSNCFVPQLHCREHMNVGRWMHDLKSGNRETLLAFENHMIGVGGSFSADNVFGYMDAFNTSHSTNEELAKILTDAHEIFKTAFGVASQSFVASCYVWNNELENALKNLGIRFIQSAIWQNYPSPQSKKKQYKRRIHFTGERNRLGQVYSVRNCTYEPAYYHNPAESAKLCFDEVKRSFAAKKPAIICSHRFNYIGSIFCENRNNNLLGLRKLLQNILCAFPDAEFVSSPQLFSIMTEDVK